MGMNNSNSNRKVEELLLSEPCVSTLKEVAMNGTGVCYKEDGFVESLTEEWKEWYMYCMCKNREDAWWEDLEYWIRKKLVCEILPPKLDSSTLMMDDALLEEGMEEVLYYTKVTEQVCHALLYHHHHHHHHQREEKNNNSDDDDHHEDDGGGGGGLPAVGVNVLKKLPFAVVEDVLDGMNPKCLPVYWKFCHDCFLQDWLSKDAVGNTKLVVIRMCNKLLTSLQDPTQRSSILLFLAKIFPLSERSALNVLGRFHTSNHVLYDHNTTTTTSSSTTHHALYEPFWNLQSYFTDPNLLLPSATKSTSAMDFATWKELLTKFTSDWTAILTEWESSPLTLNNNNNNTNNNNNNNNNKNSSRKVVVTQKVEYWKFLTSPALFLLQMETDVELRIHVLVQFLLLEGYWSQKIQQCASALYDATWKEFLRNIQPRIHDCLKQCCPSLPPILHFILTQREVLWKEWKRTKCSTPMEKPRLPPPPTTTTTTTDTSCSNKEEEVNLSKENSKVYSVSISRESLKLKQQQQTTTTTTTEKKQNQSTTFQTTNTNNHNNGMEITTFCQPYVEALDPDAGIEDEYHPKHDSLFCWRALRLICRHTIPTHLQKSNGNFERLLRTIYKNDFPNEPPIPGTPPDDDDNNDDDLTTTDNNNNNNNKDEQEEQEDGNDHHSVINPDEDDNHDEKENHNDDNEEEYDDDDDDEPSVRIRNNSDEEDNEDEQLLLQEEDDDQEQQQQQDNDDKKDIVIVIDKEEGDDDEKDIVVIDETLESKKEKENKDEEDEEEGTILESVVEKKDTTIQERERKRKRDDTKKKSSSSQQQQQQQQQQQREVVDLSGDKISSSTNQSDQRYNTNSNRQPPPSNRSHWRGNNNNNNNNNNDWNNNRRRYGGANNNNNNNNNNAGGHHHHANHGNIGQHHHGHHHDRTPGPQRRRPRRN